MNLFETKQFHKFNGYIYTRTIMVRTPGILIICTLLSASYVQGQGKTTMDLYNIEIRTIQGDPLDLNTLKGKKVLFVNVASECGYTPQYANLQELYSKHKSKLEIVGVPCNQFGGQEPGSAKEIQDFCNKNYGVTFTLTEKVDVKGKNQHPLYNWLTSKELNGAFDAEVKWNFHKFLINEDGQLIKEYSSAEIPLPTDL